MSAMSPASLKARDYVMRASFAAVNEDAAYFQRLSGVVEKRASETHGHYSLHVKRYNDARKEQTIRSRQGRESMAWIDIPLNHIVFGLFAGSTAGATVSVAAADLKLCRYKALSNDTVIIDFRIGKAFFHPANAAVTGITMELSVPFGSVFFPALGNPNSFMDAGQSVLERLRDRDRSGQSRARCRVCGRAERTESQGRPLDSERSGHQHQRHQRRRRRRLWPDRVRGHTQGLGARHCERTGPYLTTTDSSG